jgi:type II secretion system protein C
MRGVMNLPNTMREEEGVLLTTKKGRAQKRKALLAVKLTLALVLGHVIVRTTLTPQHSGETLAANVADCRDEKTAVEAPVVPDGPAPDYSAIVERDLFGSHVSSSKAVESAPPDHGVGSVQPSDDELRIALLGTVAGSPAVSRAIIKDTETNVLGQYKTGDTVLTASIESIEKDRIVLLHRGQRRIVTLHAKESAPEAAAGARVAVRANVSKPVRVAPSPKPRMTFADKFRRAAIMLPKASVESHTVQGKVEGLRLTDLENIEGVEDLGLREGDVIRAINGHCLDSKQKTFQIAMKARTQEALSVELMRDNKIRNFSLPLR